MLFDFCETLLLHICFTPIYVYRGIKYAYDNRAAAWAAAVSALEAANDALTYAVVTKPNEISTAFWNAVETIAAAVWNPIYRRWTSFVETASSFLPSGNPSRHSVRSGSGSILGVRLNRTRSDSRPIWVTLGGWARSVLDLWASPSNVPAANVPYISYTDILFHMIVELVDWFVRVFRALIIMFGVLALALVVLSPFRDPRFQFKFISFVDQNEATIKGLLASGKTGSFTPFVVDVLSDLERYRAHGRPTYEQVLANPEKYGLKQITPVSASPVVAANKSAPATVANKGVKAAPVHANKAANVAASSKAPNAADGNKAATVAAVKKAPNVVVANMAATGGTNQAPPIVANKDAKVVANKDAKVVANKVKPVVANKAKPTPSDSQSTETLPKDRPRFGLPRLFSKDPPRVVPPGNVVNARAAEEQDARRERALPSSSGTRKPN
jgi:hypothetical protein